MWLQWQPPITNRTLLSSKDQVITACHEAYPDIEAPIFILFLFCFAFKWLSKTFLPTLKVTKKQERNPKLLPSPSLHCTPWCSQLYHSSHFQSPERKQVWQGQALCWIMSTECFHSQFDLWLFPLGSHNQQVQLSLTPCTRLLSYAEPFFMPAVWDLCPASCPWSWATLTQDLECDTWCLVPRDS